MISRIILSLKKAADPSSNSWILTERVVNGAAFRNAVILAPMRGPNRDEDAGIPLDTFREL